VDNGNSHHGGSNNGMDSLEMAHILDLNAPMELSEEIDKPVNGSGQDPAPNP